MAVARERYLTPLWEDVKVLARWLKNRWTLQPAGEPVPEDETPPEAVRAETPQEASPAVPGEAKQEAKKEPLAFLKRRGRGRNKEKQS